MLGTFLVAVAVVALISALRAPTYIATATLRIATPPSPDGIVRADDIAYADRRSNTYRMLLGTQPVRDELARRLGPGGLPDVDVTLPANSELFEIHVTDTRAARAAAAANALAAILMRTADRREQVTLVQAARPPPDASSPDWMRNLAVGAILGLLGGVALAILLERRDTRLRGARDIERAIHSDVLAEIPGLRAQAALYNTGSQQEEAFRGLRTSILALARNRAPGAILVTGTRSGTEACAVAANLAEALSVAGLRVVAVDADLRTPQLHRAFGIGPEHGLAEVLEGEDTWRHAICAAAAGRVDVLAAGVPVQNPGRLLGSPELAAVLNELRVDYDAIVLAAPPLLSVNDAELVAQAADGVLLVLLRGRVTQDEAQRVSRRLGLLSTPLLGVVVTDPVRVPGRWRMPQAAVNR